MMNKEQRFTKMVLRYEDDLLSWARFNFKNPPAPEDLVQDTFLRAWRFFDQLEDPEKAKPWLITILRREYARHWELAWNRIEGIIYCDPVDIPDGKCKFEPKQDDHIFLEEILTQCSPTFSTTVELRLLGHGHEEVGEIIGVPKNTVGVRFKRFRDKVRNEL
jgi:RNA polymerase sigma-70 factor (ECF subfamily)|tara:strand:- start:1911 stop:2396 length:486 start_codon:yes stop_codon:yes gene_type:complete